MANKQKPVKKAKKTKILKLLYPLALILVFLVVYNQIFDKKVNLGGDNIGYYSLGVSLAQGEGYAFIHEPKPKPHSHFPPGYPAFLAFFIYLFSSNIIFLKIINGVLLLGSCLLLYNILNRILSNQKLAFALSLLMLFNYHLLSYSTIMMSEIPFIFFSMLAILFFILSTEKENPFKSHEIYLVILLTAYSYYIRSIGIALLGGLLLYLLFRKKFKYFFSLLFGFIALSLPWFLRGRSLEVKSSYLDQLTMKNPYRPEEGQANFSDLLKRVGENLERYVGIEIPNAILPYKTISYGDLDITATNIITGVLLLALICYGIIKLPKHRDLFIWYLLGTFAILMLWPQVWFGIRFMISLIPFLLFLISYGAFKLVELILSRLRIAKKINPLLIICFAFLFIPNIKKLHSQSSTRYYQQYKDYFDAGSWVNKNTPENSIVCARKPGLLYLYAHRKAGKFLNTYDFNRLLERLIDDGITHVVLDQLGYKDESRYLVPVILANPEKFRVLKQYSTTNTYILEFNPDLGYQGSWKQLPPDEKTEMGKSVKEGTGRFVYPDGRVFEGNWVDDKKEGPGKMIYPNGTIVEGIWQNDEMISVTPQP